jgi:pilus assembly protein CpaB
MSLRTGLIVVLAVVVGLTAAVGVAKYSEGLGGSQLPEETVTLVVATADIPRGTTVTPEMVRTRDYPKSVAPAGAVARLEDATQRIPRDNLLKDEPVLEARLSPKGSSPGFANVIPPGMRVISIKTPNVASVGSGFILPGNKVDVLFTKRSQNFNDPNGGGTTTLLVQMVEVLAINQKSDPQSDNKMDMKDIQSATLLVTPEQMLQIDLAQALGTLTLALRNGDDKSAAFVRPYTAHDIEFHVGKPFTSQFKDVTEAIAKAWADMQEANAKAAREKEKTDRDRAAKEPPKEAPKPAQAEPQTPLTIRTIRNNVPSQVEVPSAGKQ